MTRRQRWPKNPDPIRYVDRKPGDSVEMNWLCFQAANNARKAGLSEIKAVQLARACCRLSAQRFADSIFAGTYPAHRWTGAEIFNVFADERLHVKAEAPA